MAASSGFIELVVDLLAPVGPVTVRRMFGGAGIYVDGTFIAIVDNDLLYFKTDLQTRRDFQAEGMGPFTYDTKHGPGTLDSYWRAPERLYDEPDEMARWARAALAVARAAARRKATAARPRSGKAKPQQARAVAKTQASASSRKSRPDMQAGRPSPPRAKAWTKRARARKPRPGCPD